MSRMGVAAVSEHRLRAVIVLTFVAGVVLAVSGWRAVDPSVAIAFVAAAAATELLPARVRDGVYVTLSSVVYLTALLYGGWPLAVCAVSGAPISGWRHYADRRVQRLTFNFGQLAIAATAAGAVFTLLGGRPGPDAIGAWTTWVALLAGAVAYALVNNLLVAVAIRLSSGERIASSLASLLGSSVALQVMYAGLAVLAAALLLAIGPEAVLFLVVPAVVARYALMSVQAETRAYDRLVSALLKAIEVKDGYTRGHTERVSTLCVEVARELGVPYAELRAVRYAAKLHDVGKLGVPISVINKPGALDADEFAMIREHPTIGAEILGEIEFLEPALDGVRFHHERVDGGGYPFGVSGDRLPMVARIITVCDAFDAMTTTRSYRRAMGIQDAVAELRRCAGSQFDHEVVEVLRAVVARLDWQPTPEPFPVAPQAAVPEPVREHSGPVTRRRRRPAAVLSRP